MIRNKNIFKGLKNKTSHHIVGENSELSMRVGAILQRHDVPTKTQKWTITANMRIASELYYVANSPVLRQTNYPEHLIQLVSNVQARNLLTAQITNELKTDFLHFV